MEFFRDFFNRIRERVAGVTGVARNFITRTVDEAQGFLGAKWRTTTQNVERLRTASSFNVNLRIVGISNIRLADLRRREATIISDINSHLTRLRIGWRIRRQTTRDTSIPIFVNNRGIRFNITKVGTLPIKAAVVGVGGFLTLKGIIITGITLTALGAIGGGIIVYNATRDELTSEEKHDLFMTLSEEERQAVLREQTREAFGLEEGFLEQIQGTIGQIIILVIIGFVIYILIQTKAIERITKKQ